MCDVTAGYYDSFKDYAFETERLLGLIRSIGSVVPEDALHRAAGCMARHLEPGGVSALEPWFQLCSGASGRLTSRPWTSRN